MEESLILKKEVTAFLRSTAHFLELIEHADKRGARGFLAEAAPLLAKIYAQIYSLPIVETDEDAFAQKFCSEFDWEFAQQKTSRLLASHDSFFDLTEPSGFEDAIRVNVSMSECFADIYQSMFDISHTFRVESEEAAAAILSDLQATFADFLGVRLLGLAQECHLLLHSGIDLAEL